MKADNFDQWERELDGTFRVELPKLAHGAVVAMGLEALKVAMETTPVDKGRARGNWQLTLDKPAEGEVTNIPGRFPGKDELPAGVAAPSVMEAAAAVLNANPEDGPRDVWLHNGLVYIGVLNNGGTNREAHQMLERARAAVEARLQGVG